ncbi:MAG: hypothetical protein NZZ41_04590 [Candidatus Dojkabacteria bacterium]|nr:hypothetical protein [Candidatus Dojkabacteria bacterium]
MSNKLNPITHNETSEVKIGDIFYVSYGKWERYVKFFKVTNILNEKEVKIIEIGQNIADEPKQHSWEVNSQEVSPNPGEVIGNEFLAQVSSDNPSSELSSPYLLFEWIPGQSEKAEKVREGETFTIMSFVPLHI